MTNNCIRIDIESVVGGLLGCCGVIRQKWYRMTFAYLAWAILLTIWWLFFVAFYGFKFYQDMDWKHFWDMLWSIGLFLWTGYTCYVINKYYKFIKPEGAKWCAFCCNNKKKQPGYHAIE